MELMKVPPQSIEEEEQIIKAILYESDVLDATLDLKPEMFYKESNQIIFDNILQLKNKGITPDITSLVDNLKKNNQLDEIGGAYEVSMFSDTDFVFTAKLENIKHYVDTIKNNFLKRELIRLSYESVDKAFSNDSDAVGLLSDFSSNIGRLINTNISSNGSKMEDVSKEVLEDVERIQSSEDRGIEVSTGLKDLDKIIFGLNRTDNIIIAARPSMGKTAFALQLARNISKQNVPLVFFSIEMGKKQLGYRILSGESGVSFDNIRNENLTTDQWRTIHKKSAVIEKFPMIIDDTPALQLDDFKNLSRKYHKQYGIRVIIIDYLQLMVGDQTYKNKVSEVESISKACKAIAKELDVTVIALSQLSRDVEKRGGSKIPKLSDLRDSGAIEQDADIVLFPHRPYHVGDTIDDNGASTYNLANIIVAKNRNGALGFIDTYVNNDKTNWEDSRDFQS